MVICIAICICIRTVRIKGECLTVICSYTFSLLLVNKLPSAFICKILYIIVQRFRCVFIDDCIIFCFRTRNILIPCIRYIVSNALGICISIIIAIRSCLRRS